MYHILIREVTQTKNAVAWSESDFLFREYVKAVTKRFPYQTFHIEHCNTRDELRWVFKKYNVIDTNITHYRIILINDRSKTIYGVTTCFVQRVGLGSGSLFQSTEDKVRCTYVSDMLHLITYLKRFFFIEEEKIASLYRIVGNSYLDRHSIDMWRYFIENDEYTNFYKL